MTTNTAQKRLDEIEIYLTPKEWAIRLADEYRRYPTAMAYMKAMSKLALHELPVQRPYFAFEEQATKRHPGHKPDQIRARNRLREELWAEFHTLTLLIRQVNRTIQRTVERIGLEAALRLAALHGLILEDAFACAAADGAAWVKAQHPAKADAKRQRQAVLNQLAASTEAGIGEASRKNLPSQPPFLDFPSPLEEWSHKTCSLLTDFYAHRAAVELVQAEHFAAHPILWPEVEAELLEVTRTIESAIATANEYFNSRPERDEAGTNGRAGERDLGISLESIKASAKGQRAAAIAEKWFNDARREAVESDEDMWEKCRQEFGTKKRNAAENPPCRLDDPQHCVIPANGCPICLCER